MLDANGREIQVGDFVVHTQAPLFKPMGEEGDRFWGGHRPVQVTGFVGRLAALDLKPPRTKRGRALPFSAAFLPSLLTVVPPMAAEGEAAE